MTIPLLRANDILIASNRTPCKGKRTAAAVSTWAYPMKCRGLALVPHCMRGSRLSD